MANRPYGRRAVPTATRYTSPPHPLTGLSVYATSSRSAGEITVVWGCIVLFLPLGVWLVFQAQATEGDLRTMLFSAYLELRFSGSEGEQLSAAEAIGRQG